MAFAVTVLAEDDYYGFTITGNRRYLLGDFTVTHNTLAAISIAQEFIKVYRKLYAVNYSKMQAGRKNYAELDRMTPTVFVLGFGSPKAAFLRELLKYPDFGFITYAEKDELKHRIGMAESGLPDDVKHLDAYRIFLKKRITNKNKGGFYKFYGYDEFVNRLFSSETVKLTDLEVIANQRAKAGDTTTLEEIILEHIKAGKIHVNMQLLDMFKNSLMICDELHNTYNMSMKNNRGVAIQYVLDIVETVRLLGLSATPLSNSPTEAVDFVNYLVPASQKFTKKGLFLTSRTMVPGGLEALGRATRGRISFLQDVNIKYFPKRVFVGESLILPADVGGLHQGDTLPYLKFIICPMSELHQATYNAHVAQTTESDNYHSIPTDGYSIYDLVLPSPDASSAPSGSTPIGIFRSSDVRNKISMAPAAWKLEHKISMKKYSTTNSILVGDFLRRENIGLYSAKYEKLLDIIFEIVQGSGGDGTKCEKIMIYHDRVKMSGVLMIQELLKANDMIDEHSEPTDATLCCVCGKPLSAHVLAPHEYIPIRFVVAHSDMDKSTMDASLAKFNGANNTRGHKYMILVGSKIIKESYDFKDIRELIVMSLPINFPTLLQVFGRCVRKDSHVNLPPEQRQVNIRMLISTVNPKYPAGDLISPELYRYVDKLADYIAIQEIEREWDRNAIDGSIHRDIIMPMALKDIYHPNGRRGPPIDMLGNLYFDPAYEVPDYKAADLSAATFNAYKYYEEEIRTQTYIIKRLFTLMPVWSYDDLWKTVQAPPFGIETNPALFGENNFIIALYNLVNRVTPVLVPGKHAAELTEGALIERLFDYNERHIYIGGARHKIEHVGKYYILFPISALPPNPLNIVHTEYTEYVRDKERAMIKETTESADKVIVDVETYLRKVTKPSSARISIDAFIRESRENINYIAKREQFAAAGKITVVSFLTEYSARFQMSFVEEAIIHMIMGSAGTLKVSESLRALYTKVIALMTDFGVIIYSREVLKYKDTAKQYKIGVPKVGPAVPLGYTTAKSVRLFDPQVDVATTKITPEILERGRWLEVSKVALNRHMAYKENDVVIGYLETAEDSTRFKLRKPVHRIKDAIAKDVQVRKITQSEAEGASFRTVVGDTRLIEKGIVCETKNKQDLLQIVAALGISSIDKTDARIRKLCEVIKEKLIANEIKERIKDSRYKYLYGWWDEVVNLSA